jgi:hypothetical protein
LSLALDLRVTPKTVLHYLKHEDGFLFIKILKINHMLTFCNQKVAKSFGVAKLALPLRMLFEINTSSDSSHPEPQVTLNVY